MAGDSASGAPGAERRSNPHLRAVFDKACRIAAPFFDGDAASVGYTSSLSAHRALREDFPELPQQDIAILLSSVKAYLRTRAKSQPAP